MPAVAPRFARRLLLGSLAAPGFARAQAAPARVAMLRLGGIANAPVIIARGNAFRQGLAEAARASRPAEIIERLVADSAPATLRAAALELAALAPAAFLAVGPATVAAVREAAPGIPLIAIDLETDPVAAGWVASVSRPGGSLTGIFLDAADLAAKWLQLLGEVRPGLTRVGLVWDPATGPYQRDAAAAMAARLGITLTIQAAADQQAVPPAIAALAKAGVEAVLLLSSPMFGAVTERVAAATNAAGLPGIMLFREYPANGGLIAYGPDTLDVFRRAGGMVQRVVEGAKPGDLPLERPVRFILALNLGTARQLGLDLPPTLLARADEVID